MANKIPLCRLGIFQCVRRRETSLLFQQQGTFGVSPLVATSKASYEPYDSQTAVCYHSAFKHLVVRLRKPTFHQLCIYFAFIVPTNERDDTNTIACHFLHLLMSRAWSPSEGRKA